MIFKSGSTNLTAVKGWQNSSMPYLKLTASPYWTKVSGYLQQMIIACKSYHQRTHRQRTLCRLSSEQRHGSRCGFNIECRKRLQKFFGSFADERAHHGTVNTDSPVSLDSPAESQRSVAQGNNIAEGLHSHLAKLPPAEILDMSLDLYFRHWHPLLPFVHIPTFSPQSIKDHMLFIMCLIGLTIINTRGARAFVRLATAVSQSRDHPYKSLKFSPEPTPFSSLIFILITYIQ
jgi:hypothetical protein